MLVMLDKQVSWLFLRWNMILLGSFYDTITNKQHEIVFLDTNNNFKHLIFMPVTPYCKKKNYMFYQFFLKYLSSLFIDLKKWVKTYSHFKKELRTDFGIEEYTSSSSRYD